MNTASYDTLEFSKVLSRLASFAISSLGRECISAIAPLKDLPAIEEQLSEVSEFRAIIDFDDSFPIDGFDDIRTALRKASVPESYLLPEELVQVMQVLAVFRRISDYFRRRGAKYPLLENIASEVTSFQSIEKAIARCIKTDTHEIDDHASPNLARIRRSIDSLQQSIRKKIEGMLTSLSKKDYLQEDVVTIRDGRLVLMVKNEHRHHVRGVVHDQSATGATVFVEPLESLELNNQIRALRSEEKREIEKILKELTALIRNQMDGIQRSSSATGRLEFIYAKAHFSAEIDGHQPSLNASQILDIVKGRHPLLLLHKGKKDQVMPIDLRMGDSFRTLIITGPNAGGKTVALKTIGLLCLMASCGLHIPVDPTSEICIFRNIFSVIGDAQSIENDLSTFSSHVEQLKTVVDHVTAHDLVIIDEIGAGTDPEEGAALAIALLERLTSMGCLTVVSTHQGALKAFAHDTAFVENGSMEFDSETLQPTYRFRLKLPGSSYAFEIAQRWGLPGDIIDRSRQLIGVDKNRMENLLIDLDRKLSQYQAQLKDVSLKRTELDALIKFYRERGDELKRHEKKLKAEAVQKSEEIMQSASAAVERAIKEIREQQASHEAIKKAQHVLKEEQKKLSEQRQQIKEDEVREAGVPVGPATMGMKVKWKTFNKVGTISSDVDASDRVLIDTGEVKVKVPVSELVAVTEEAKKDASVHVYYDITRTSTPEIDLRGMMAEEALASTDKFIEQAVMSGLNEIYIIHGKGTGVLRQSIHRFLETHPHVKCKRIADWNQGGTGMTIVELK